MRRLLLVPLLVGAGTMVTAVAHAQVPTVDPHGGAPVPTGPTPNPYGYPTNNVPAAPAQVPGPAPGAPSGAPGTPGGPAGEGIYIGPNGPDRQVNPPEGALDTDGNEIPEVHVIQKGDTLWDICKYYFNDPWRWPEVWSYNPSITNPHWIYPGNIIRLRSGTAAATATAPTSSGTAPTPEPTAYPPIAPTHDVISLHETTFVSIETLALSGVVRGAAEEETMLSLNDDIFIDYPPGKPPEIGTRYTIYAPDHDIIHPTTGEKIGVYAYIRGQALITEVKKGRNARGEIVSVTSQGTVMRGDRVGPLVTELETVDPTPGLRNVEGVVVATLGHIDIAGLGELVLVDHGKTDGLVPGNVMRVVRRGDAYPPEVGDGTTAGENDRHFPDTIIGEVAILAVSGTTSVGLVTRSDREIEIADHVVITKPLMDEESPASSTPAQ